MAVALVAFAGLRIALAYWACWRVLLRISCRVLLASPASALLRYSRTHGELHRVSVVVLTGFGIRCCRYTYAHVSTRKRVARLHVFGNSRLAAFCYKFPVRLVGVVAAGNFKGVRWEGRAPRLSRVQPRLDLTRNGLRGLHKKNKELIPGAQNTLKEEVALDCNLHVACSAGETWPHEDVNGDSQRPKSTQRLDP
jgi:hypothetical protein